VYQATRQWDKALQALTQASRLSPQSRDVWYRLGQVHHARSEPDRALAALRRALEVSEGHVGRSNLYFQLGYVQQYSPSSRDLKAAWAAYEQAQALDEYLVDSWQKAETYHQKGVILAGQNRWAEAIPEYQRALASNPRRYGTHLVLAQALWQVGQRAEAIAHARQALEIDPNRKNAYHVLGNFYTAEQKVKEASAMYTRILELDPQDQRARKALEALR
jgi:tetratricopeptide (TPR) repeat protein